MIKTIKEKEVSIMEKQVSFKKGENLVTIDFKSKDYFAIFADLSKVTLKRRDETVKNVREDIENNLDLYVNELQDKSINELIDSEVDDIMNADGIMGGYDNSPYAMNHGTDLIKVAYFVGGQCYDDLLEMLPDCEPIAELIELWKKYQLKGGVETPVINRVVELLNQLDSGKNEDDLAEAMVKDYIKENY